MVAVEEIVEKCRPRALHWSWGDQMFYAVGVRRGTA